MLDDTTRSLFEDGAHCTEFPRSSSASRQKTRTLLGWMILLLMNLNEVQLVDIDGTLNDLPQ